MAGGEWDVVVAGAGHNSLVTAAYLARAGLRCLVLEARPAVGGDTSSEELTLPGFLHDTCSTAHNLIQASPTLRHDELGLGAYGLEYLHPDPVVHLPFPDGASITQWRDPEATAAELARFSGRDAAAYLRLLADYEAVAPAYGRYRYTPVGWGPTLQELLLAGPDGPRWARRAAMSAWDNIAERFEDDHVRAFMAWMAFMTVQPVDRPGGGLLAFSLVAGRQRHSWVLPKGGSAALPRALAALVEDHGGTVLTGRRVVGLVLAGGRCVGVETDAGESFTATSAVVSTIHVKDLVGMAPPEAWGDAFTYGVESWQAGIGMFAAHYALSEPVRFPAPEGGDPVVPVASGTPGSVERLLAAGHDVAAGRLVTEDPVLLVLCPTVADPTRAPAGHHTLKVIGFQPYAPGGRPDPWDEVKQEVADANLAHLRRFAPDLSEDAVLAARVESPLDLERRNSHNWHGSCHGGDMGPAQSGPLRPAPGWAGHRMPIPGLYQTGATTHPGGSVSAGPGRNAAMVVLSDLGTSLEEVVAGRRPLAGAGGRIV
ncbi:MAG: phytoene desaturase family protein [Acidimicrobiales bacterium]